MCMVYNTIEDIHLGLDGGMEIQNNMGVSLEELKTSFVELVLVDNPYIFDNLITLDMKPFMTTTPIISTTTQSKFYFNKSYVLRFCYSKVFL